MTDPTPQSPDDTSRPEFDRLIVDRAVGPAERTVLGRNPYGSMLRVAGFVLGFIVLFGAVFAWLAAGR